MGTIFVDNLEPQSGTSLTLGASGDTVNLGSGGTVTNVPAFYAYLGSNISDFTANQYNTIVYNTEAFDTNSDYDNSTGIFTPSVAGKYYCFASP